MSTSQVSAQTGAPSYISKNKYKTPEVFLKCMKYSELNKQHHDFKVFTLIGSQKYDATFSRRDKLMVNLLQKARTKPNWRHFSCGITKTSRTL